MRDRENKLRMVRFPGNDTIFRISHWPDPWDHLLRRELREPQASAAGRAVNVLRTAILIALLSLCVNLPLVDSSQCSPQQRVATAERAACPSTEFTAFFRDFSEKAAIQKSFTRIPLVYGTVDISSDRERLLEEKINYYERIPTLNRKNGLIFPDEKERTIDRRPGQELHFLIKDGFTDDFTGAPENWNIGIKSQIVTVLLYINETGYQVYYKFKKDKHCWFLVRIDDKST